MSVVHSPPTRAEFLAERRKAIGASDAAGILGLSQWTTPWEVWADKTGRLEDDGGNAATRAGVLLEPAVLDFAEAELGVLDRDVRVAAPDGLPLVATCDAQVIESGRPVEAKTTGIAGPVYGTWGDALTDQVPTEYLVQVHAQLICTQQEIGYLFALIPGRGVVEFHIEKNERLHSHLCERLAEWWDRHVVQGIEPPVEPVAPSLDVVKRLRREPGKSIEASAKFVDLLKSRDGVKQTLKDSKKLLDEIEAEMLLNLGDAEVAKLPDGGEFTYLESERKGYTVQPSKYRSMRIRKSKAR